jgi:hypothetical protein
MVATAARIQLLEKETQDLLDWAEAVHDSDETLFHKAQTLATRLGAHYRADGLTEIGFWAPELGADMVQPKNIFLEIFTPKKTIDPYPS